MGVHVPTQILSRALAFVSKEETRYYLCGVHIVCQEGNVRVEATDGTALYVWGRATEGDEAANPFDVVVPTETIKAALKAAGKRLKWLSVAPQGDSYVSVGDLGGKPIDGTFPDIARVIPKSTSGKTDGFTFNPDLLVRIAKAFGTQSLGLVIFANGVNPAFVRTPDMAEGELVVIMPARGGPDKTAHDMTANFNAAWAREKKDEATPPLPANAA